MKALPAVTPEPPRHDEFAGPTPGVYFIDKEDVNQSNVQIVGLGIDRHNPDVPAIVVMNEILGGGFGSRLFQKIRTQLGLAYAVGGGFELPYDHPGEFRVEVLTKSATTVEATSDALERDCRSEYRSPSLKQELKRAKDDILNSFLFRYDTKDKILAERERLEFYGYPADYLETYEAALEKVTLADVTAAAKKYIHPAKLAVLVVGNGPEIKHSQAWTRWDWARRSPSTSLSRGLHRPTEQPEQGRNNSEPGRLRSGTAPVFFPDADHA